MKNKILLIEDDKSKIEKVITFLNEYEIVIKESFHSGVKELKDFSQDYIFLILDMTIPMWEKGKNDLGGNYEQFGGERILREIKRKKIIIPTILFTMFDIFTSVDKTVTFQELNILYKKKYGEFYIGGVYYNSTDDYWKEDMSKLIKQVNE